MTLPAKVAGTAVVIGGGSLAGCYFGGVFDDTPWVSLKTEITSNQYQGKVGEKYSIYLLAVYGSEPGKTDSKDFNKSKWEELYKQYLKDLQEGVVEMSPKFVKDSLDGAYDPKVDSPSTGSKKLNRVCESLYNMDEVTSGSSTGINFSKPNSVENKVDSHKLAENLLKYCSSLGQKPTSIGDDEYTGNVIGAGSSKGELASAKKSENYYFWQAQQKWFETEASGAQSNEFFKSAFKDGKLITDLKSKCGEAYGLPAKESGDSDRSAPTLSDVKKYCSFRDVTSSS